MIIFNLCIFGFIIAFMKEANIPPFKDKSKRRTRNHLPSSQVDAEKNLQSQENMNQLYL